MLDAGADANDPRAKQTAAQRFPHDELRAREQFLAQGVKNGGTLPWACQSRYSDLVNAMRSGKSRKIIHGVIGVVRCVSDAALPFNATRDRNGIASGNLHWPVRANAASIDRSVRHRVHMGLLTRHEDQFAYEVRVAPGRFCAVDNPLEAIFDLLLESRDTVDQWASVDRQLIAKLEITDATSFANSAEEYYQSLVDRAAPVMEQRLEAAALLSANLIGTAWNEADRPSPALWTDQAAPSSTANSKNARNLGYVGSRNSKIYHKTGCSHAKRIQPNNLVLFDSAESAVNAGRTACRTCKPDNQP